MIRFVLYGLCGWCAEILWTALYDAIAGTTRAAGDTVERRPLTRRERLRLVGQTYLWMFPIYGSAALLFEPAHEALRHQAWPIRGAAWMAGIFAVEYVAGWLLKRATGACPWDYSYARTSVSGYIRLDYAPVWFVFGLILERIHDAAVAIEPALRAALAA